MPANESEVQADDNPSNCLVATVVVVYYKDPRVVKSLDEATNKRSPGCEQLNHFTPNDDPDKSLGAIPAANESRQELRSHDELNGHKR